MNEKNNLFRFSLYQEDVLLCEKCFDADAFNPFTRYSIDIRDILPQSITKLQKVLSKKRYDVCMDVGNDQEIDFLRYNNKMINLYPNEYKSIMKYSPKSINQEIEDKIIRGVECKIGLYINENTIVERVFYVDGFNPVSRYSMDVYDAVMDIVYDIFNSIKKNDIKNMWDDYDLINRKGLNINQIRDLSRGKRAFLLRSLN